MITVGDILQLIFWVYWGGMLLVMALVYWVLRFFVPKGKRRWAALVSVLGVGLVFVLPVVMAAYQEQQRKQARRARYQAAKAVFDERCKNAGEKIYRTAENVEGVMLIKVRPNSTDANWRDPMWADAAMARDSGEAYISIFVNDMLYNNGQYYQYTDVIQDGGQAIMRYIGSPDPNDHAVQQIGYPRKPARYAVDYTNDVNPQDRQHWVAGTTIRVIDRETNEVMAEKVIYAFDEGLGSTATARSPGLAAITCPYEYDYERHTVLFVNKVLHPKQEKQP